MIDCAPARPEMTSVANDRTTRLRFIWLSLSVEVSRRTSGTREKYRQSQSRRESDRVTKCHGTDALMPSGESPSFLLRRPPPDGRRAPCYSVVSPARLRAPGGAAARAAPAAAPA